MADREEDLRNLKERSAEAARKVAVAQSQNQESKERLKEILKDLKLKGITSVDELNTKIENLETELEKKIKAAEKALDEAGL